MKSYRVVSLSIVLIAALALPATATAERKNPYTATEVCGPGYKPIDRHKLVDSNHG